MVAYEPQPRLKLSKLRDIGWGIWDPIGLLLSGSWNDLHNRSFANEYDNYLISAAAQLRLGATYQDVVDYLVRIETDHMGLSATPETQNRAAAVVAAIVADPTIWTWPDKQGRFSQD